MQAPDAPRDVGGGTGSAGSAAHPNGGCEVYTLVEQGQRPRFGAFQHRSDCTRGPRERPPCAFVLERYAPAVGSKREDSRARVRVVFLGSRTTTTTCFTYLEEPVVTAVMYVSTG